MKKVILVDDNEYCMEGILSHIDWAGLDAEVSERFTNPLEALTYTRENHVDLIISDISMPQMTGIDLAKKLLALQPYVKIIFISAYDDFKYAKEAIRLDICDYVEKPVDYTYLSSVMASALKQADEEKRMLELAKQSKPAMIQRFFQALFSFSPSYSEQYLKEESIYLQIDFSCNAYLCVTVQFPNFSNISSSMTIEHYHLQVVQLAERFKATFEPRFLCYVVPQGNEIHFILGSPLKMDDFEHDVYQRLVFIREQYESSHLLITIGMGSSVEQMWHMAASYQQAQRALRNKFILGEGQVFAFKDLKAANSMLLSFQENDEETMIQLISKKGRTDIEQFVEQLKEKWMTEQADQSSILAYLYTLLAKLLRFMQEVDLKGQEVTDKVTRFFQQIDQCDTVTAICEQVQEVLFSAHEALQTSIKSNQSRLVEKVIQFIDQHYMDADLSVQDIASYVQLSPSYLGTVFKQEHGKSVSKVLTCTRTRHAQRLLESTALSVATISEKVGYANPYYFSACFKKIVRQTPTDYRMSMTNSRRPPAN